MKQAVYIVEFQSISHGIGVLDRMLKRAGLLLLHAGPICIGKYLICVGGDVADVREAQNAAHEPDDDGVPLADCLLTGVHPGILSYFALEAPKEEGELDAIGILETRDASSGFLGLDTALKNASVRLLRVWLGQFLGGKYCFVIGGGTSEVQSALLAAQSSIPAGHGVGHRLIPAPDPHTVGLFVRGQGQP